MNTEEIFDKISNGEVDHVYFRFTDLLGRWFGIEYHVRGLNQATLEEGIMFDGSSIPGWRDISDSDMLLKPDLSTAIFDCFAGGGTLVIICDVFDPKTEKAYDRDPRGVARKAEAYLIESGVGDTAFFGPEAEFFIFDDVDFVNEPNHSLYHVKSEEMPESGDNEHKCRLGQSIQYKDGYTRLLPHDKTYFLRQDMVKYLGEMGVSVEKHHHEVATCQGEIGIKYDTLLAMADKMQVYKYVVVNTALMHEKSATFMPKPLHNDNGSGMHVHQSIWSDKTPLFPGEGYGGLSKTALHYIGGILKHGKALNAFTNPSTNSYKRLVPGFEAPVFLAYSARNRSVACRVPHTQEFKARRLETRFPDPLANPYLAFSALLMAGLDGIQNKIDPGEALEGNAYEMDQASVPMMARSLEEALEALDRDREFLVKGGVFSHEQIDAYISLKEKEAQAVRETVNPMEYKLYYAQ